MSDTTIRTLVVDDSALYRSFVRSVLESIPGVEVVGTAPNGVIGLQKIQSLKPDLITLDQEMPELDGLGLLRELTAQEIEVASIMISSATEAGAKITNTALQLGAFDFVLKPIGKGPEDSQRQLTADLSPKIQAFVEGYQRKRKAAPPAGKPSNRMGAPDAIASMLKNVSALQQLPQIVAIGVSTGGPAALNKMLPKLPQDFPCPIVIVQHMPPKFTKSLAEDLDRVCQLTVKEAAEGMVAKAGEVLIAPGGSQMRIAKLGGQATVQITDDPPERNCKPAVDYLFRSVANTFGGRSLGVVLTGMGDDGTLGCQSLKNAGARVITQDEATCVVYGMPRCVNEAGLSDQIAPLNRIAECICVAAGKEATL